LNLPNFIHRDLQCNTKALKPLKEQLKLPTTQSETHVAVQTAPIQSETHRRGFPILVARPDGSVFIFHYHQVDETRQVYV
jgi:hypothetical protein